MRQVLKSSSLLKSGLNNFNKGSLAYKANYSSATIGAKTGSNKLLLGAFAVATVTGSYYYLSGPKTQFQSSSFSSASDQILSPKEFKSFKLSEVKEISHDTKLFRFELPADRSLDLPIASCVVTKASGKDGKCMIKPYTPTSKDNAKGHFDFIIKQYEGGAMSTHIHNLKPGDILEVMGPLPKYPYTANKHSEIGLIAGGTGITPMLQLIRKVLDNPQDKTKINFIFANRTTKDILLKDELDKLAKEHADRFKIKYVISNNEPGWNGEVGHVNKEMIKNMMKGGQHKDSMVFVCGPPGMVNAVSGPIAPDYTQGEVSGILKELGYTSENVFKF